MSGDAIQARANEPYRLDLTSIERKTLSDGVFEWCGASNPTEELAQAFGFVGVGSLVADCKRLAALVAESQPLTGEDWRLSIALAEVCLGSGVFGAADDLEYTLGVAPGPAVAVLSDVRRKWRRAQNRRASGGEALAPLGTAPLGNLNGVFQPGVSPAPLSDAVRRTALLQTLQGLLYSLARGDVSGRSEAEAKLRELGFVDDLASWIGVSLHADEAGPAARLARSLAAARHPSAERDGSVATMFGVAAELLVQLLQSSASQSQGYRLDVT